MTHVACVFILHRAEIYCISSSKLEILIGPVDCRLSPAGNGNISITAEAAPSQGGVSSEAEEKLASQLASTRLRGSGDVEDRGDGGKDASSSSSESARSTGDLRRLM